MRTRRLIMLFILCLTLFYISCARKNPFDSNEEDETAGTIRINLIFAETNLAKTAQCDEATVNALIYIYNDFNSLIAGETLDVANKMVMKTFRVPAQNNLTVKVAGFDKLWVITYHGKTHNITVIPEQTTTVNIVMKKFGLVKIPAGSFSMGSEKGDANEMPVHTVTLDAFEMSATEVTQIQWFKMMKDNPSSFAYDYTNPVESVSWLKVIEFCNLLSLCAELDPCYDVAEKTCDLSKNGFRLPTEAEWEYACRAGTITDYYTGDTPEDLESAAWFVESNFEETRPVAEKEPNPWGLYDIHGNVSELCNDIYSNSYYESSPDTNPPGPTSRGTSRVYRGGSWKSDAYSCRSSYRSSVLQKTGSSTIGFRIVRNANP